MSRRAPLLLVLAGLVVCAAAGVPYPHIEVCNPPMSVPIHRGQGN